MGRNDQLAAVQEAWRQLDLALRRRAELVPALGEAVLAAAPHERAPCEHVEATLRRTLARQDDAPAGRYEAEDELQTALNGLERVGDAYSEVRASDDYRKAQDALFFARKEIREAAEAYNAAVAEHNSSSAGRGRFPWSRGGSGEPAEPFGKA